MYCNGGCGDDWLDNTRGCQQSDADAYCKLKLCNAEATAISYDLSAPKNEAGFACNNYGTNFGAWFGINDVWFDEDILASHFCSSCGAAVVRNVICTDTGMSIV